MSTETTLLATAAALGAVHTLAPDHWLPFALFGKARGESPAATAGTAFKAGILHLLSTALFATVAVQLGTALLAPWGLRLESLSVGVLFALGLSYAGYALALRLQGSLTGSDEQRLTHLGRRGLYTLFALDPCVPLLPILVLAAPFGAQRSLAVFAAYALATLSTMTALTFVAARGLQPLRAPVSFGRWLDVSAGAAVATTAAAMVFFG